MFVLLFQEYYMNDNNIMHMYDLTSNNVYKETLVKIRAILSYYRITVTVVTINCCFLFDIAFVLHAAVCQLA